MQYEYGYAWRDYPVRDTYTFDDGSVLGVGSVFDGAQPYMHEADLIFCDPPWNQGNLRSFYTKNEQVLKRTYTEFCSALFSLIGDIKPRTAYVEIGKEHLADYVIAMRSLFPFVTFYNSMYYRKPENHCYIVRGSAHRKRLTLDGMDEEDIIRWVCEEEDYSCIGDPCMGQGLVALYARLAGKQFVGMDINPKRLAVARKRVENKRK